MGQVSKDIPSFLSLKQSIRSLRHLRVSVKSGAGTPTSTVPHPLQHKATRTRRHHHTCAWPTVVNPYHEGAARVPRQWPPSNRNTYQTQWARSSNHPTRESFLNLLSHHPLFLDLTDREGAFGRGMSELLSFLRGWVNPRERAEQYHLP